MKTVLIIFGIIGAIIISALFIINHLNRDAETKLHPDQHDPNLWYDDEGNEYIK